MTPPRRPLKFRAARDPRYRVPLAGWPGLREAMARDLLRHCDPPMLEALRQWSRTRRPAAAAIPRRSPIATVRGASPLWRRG